MDAKLSGSRLGEPLVLFLLMVILGVVLAKSKLQLTIRWSIVNCIMTSRMFALKIVMLLGF